MPGQEEEAAAIFRWLAEEISPDTYVNVIGQPRIQGGGRRDRYQDLDRCPGRPELAAAMTAARRAGLWRFDQRVLPW